MNTVTKYLKRFFEEKSLPNKQFEIEDKNGNLHIFDNLALIENILHAPLNEKEQIAQVLRKIDFKNGSVQHFLNFLSKQLILNYAK
jgi:hypothetical protein